MNPPPLSASLEREVPPTSREKISTRVRNHETAVLKVNDAYGNPIELAAVVHARVEAAGVRMVESRFTHLAYARQWGKSIAEPDEERKGAMVSNLMVVLCGDRAPQPVLNTGTLYQ